jgi:predicted small metal-binding protein
VQEAFMSRVIDCPCGHPLRGANDDELLRLARQHVTEHHPDMHRTDDDLRQLIRARARDDAAATR